MADINCINCGFRDEPEWIIIIQLLLDNDQHWALKQYIIGLVERAKKRSQEHMPTYDTPYGCYVSSDDSEDCTDSEDWDLD